MMGVEYSSCLALQPLLEFRIALGDGDMADGIPQGTFLTDDNAEILLDIICSRLNTVYLEEEMMLIDNISLDDYTVIWPESLINDVLDDDLLDWKAIKETENGTDEDESNLDTLSTTLNIGDTIMATKDTVLETMKQAGTPLNAGKIAELSGLDRKEVDKAMKELKAEGAIVSPVRCKWEPAQK